MEGLGLLSPELVALDLERVPTPAFVIDKAALRRNLAVLRDVQDRAGCKILLALKGFAAWKLAPEIMAALPGVAASGPHEARLGREEFGGEVHTYSPAFAPRYFDDVLECSDHIIFNSVAEYQRHRARVEAHNAEASGAKASGASGGRKIECGLRVNPRHSEVTTAIYDPCAAGSRLGTTIEEFDADKLEGISGLHFHTLCELGSDALERTLAAFEEKFGFFFPKISWVNFGGGHHITKPDYDRERLIRIVRDFRERTGLEVILEPGEAIAIHTGVLVVSVLDLPKNGDSQLAILDTSATAHMPDVLEMPYRPHIFGATEPGKATHPHVYRLGGMSCLAGDVIGDYAFAEPLQIGQKLVFDDMSHYSMVKTTNFNGVQLPSIMTYEAGDDTLELVRAFGYESYRNRLS